MNQTKQNSESSPSPMFAITTSGMAIKVNSRRAIWTVLIFSALTVGAMIGIPLYGYLYRYTWLDWSLFGLLYVVSGLGITVGYHRLMAHRSFNYPNWVKGKLLIGGAWALQNSAIKWAADHLRHHAHCDKEKDPYNSICHLWGRQPHGTSDSSQDSRLVSLVTFGEGYHNYHHMYPTDYRNGPCWYYFDPSKWVIHGLYSLGLTTSLRTGSYVEDSLTRTN